jgi:putative redox protein
MITIRSKYLGDLRTEATHVKSGVKILTDAPTDNNGKGEAFSPTDLVCNALASCMMTLMGIVGKRHDIDLVNMDVEITKIMASEPRKIAEILIDFNFHNNNYTDKEKVILINAAKTCPVALSLHPDLKQTVNFNF